MLKAVTRQASAVDAKIAAMAAASGGKKTISTAYYFDHYATPEDVAVLVTEQDFLDANRELVPSISAGELAHYERVRATFEGNRQKQGAGAPAAEAPSSSGPSSGPLGTSSAPANTPGFPAPRRTRASKGKGKGKSAMRFSDVEEDDDEEDEVDADDDDVSFNNGANEVPISNGTNVAARNGWLKGKGKAAAVLASAAAAAAFQEQRVSDDEDLYQ